MQKVTAIWFVMTIALCCGPGLAQGQGENKTSDRAESAKAAGQESKSNTDQHAKSIQPFRLDFSLSELEDGKKINSRHYSINLTAGSADEVKIGTRVPLATADSSGLPQYVDVGTNIWANLREGGNELQLEVRSEVSWAKADRVQSVDSDPKHEQNAASRPIVHQMKISGSTL